MNEDKKTEILINVYKFWIGTLIIILVALVSGVSSSIRIEKYDELFFAGISLIYVTLIALAYAIMKLKDKIERL